MTLLPDSFWHLRDQVSPRLSICPLGCPEIENIEGLVHAVVDILHAHCVADISLTPLVVKALMKFLLCEVRSLYLTSILARKYRLVTFRISPLRLLVDKPFVGYIVEN